MKFLLAWLLSIIVFKASAQQFSQINTGTLFDSFENPAQRAFIPDSSRQFASNFFIPNFGGNGLLAGNGQNSIRSLIKNGTYNNSGLTSGLHNPNSVNLNFNTYWFMLKFYRRLDSDQEFGLSAQTKVEGRGSITDETLLLLNSYKNFDNGTANSDLFNDQVQAQAYHQLSLIFRRKLSPNVAIGVKLSTLLGIYYTSFNIEHSGFSVANNGTQATLFLKGKYASSYSGTFGKRDFAGYKNPGAAVSFGMQAQLESGFLLQGNIKDFGFIRWNSKSVTSDYDRSESVDRISTTRKNDSRIITEADSLASRQLTQHSFIAPVDGKADLSISKKFNVFTADFYTQPTFIVSKNLFYNGLTAAFVNHFNYKSFWFTALAMYNNDKVWNAGAQLMIKSANAEFYFGAEQLLRSVQFLSNSGTNNSKATGIGAFLGFSAKFGKVIEHPANASYISMGEEKGVFNKLWRRIFKSSNY